MGVAWCSGRQLAHCRLALVFLAGSRQIKAATLANFQTTVGNMQLELFDDEKPITVSNFVKYVTSGRFTNQFIQRWEAGFVIQAGGYTVSNAPSATGVPGPRGPTSASFSL